MGFSELKYTKLQIYYFSGTGNAKFAAKEIAELSKQKGLNTKVINIAGDELCFSELNADALIGFCYPTHGFNAPPIILKFLSRFPKGKSDIFLLNTRAGMKLFKLQTPGLGGLALWLPIDVLLIPISIGYYFFGRFALAKTLFASYKCNNCGLCIKSCPVNAISMKSDRPYWSFKCESCMKCLNNCPKRAIESSIGLNAILWWLVFSLVPYSLINYLVNQQVISKSFYLQYTKPVFYILMAVSGFAMLFSGYWIFHQLLRIKLFNKIITSLTHFKWWNRYKYKP